MICKINCLMLKLDFKKLWLNVTRVRHLYRLEPEKLEEVDKLLSLPNRLLPNPQLVKVVKVLVFKV